MKKFLVFASLAALAVSANAQVMTSRTRVKEKKPTMWYARIGVSLDNLAGGNDYKKEYTFDYSGKHSKVTIAPQAGMDIDFGFQRGIGKAGLYWGMELGFGTRGGAMRSEYSYHYEDRWDSYTVEGKSKGRLLTWNIKYSPFTFGYKYSITDDIKIDAHLGLFLSYDFAGNAKFKYDDDDDEKLSLGDLRDEYDFQAFDAGLQLGAGVWWKRFNFDITWQRGFVPLGSYYLDDRHDLYSSNVMFRLGVAF